MELSVFGTKQSGFFFTKGGRRVMNVEAGRRQPEDAEKMRQTQKHTVIAQRPNGYTPRIQSAKDRF